MVAPVTITAVLTKWRLEGSNLQGVISESNFSDYIVDNPMIIKEFKTITHYPAMRDEGEFWLVKSQMGLYFKIRAGEEDGSPSG